MRFSIPALALLFVTAIPGDAQEPSQGPVAAAAKKVSFQIPEQPADRALQEFIRQGRVDVLYPADGLSAVQSRGVSGDYEPAVALTRLLEGTGFESQILPRGGFLVRAQVPRFGGLQGRLVTKEGQPLASYRVFLQGSSRVAHTDSAGEFEFRGVPAGEIRLRVETGAGRDPLSLPLQVEPGRISKMDTWVVGVEPEVVRLDPLVVNSRESRVAPYATEGLALRPRTAVGNLDLPRYEDGPLPFVIHRRDQILRSGAINLNQYLQREMLESDGALRPPGRASGVESFLASNNLSLRGFDADETVILVNGRRLPEVVTSGASPMPPDVNFIPLSMVQQVEVLPSSASALYTGNPVGGVINIVLRPEELGHATEVTYSYGNALRGFDSPQSAVSLLHGRSLLGGRLRLRIHASMTETVPPVESELNLHRPAETLPLDPTVPLFRQTPHVRTADGSGLFGAGTPSFLSIRPGTRTAPTVDELRQRAGLLNPAEFDSYAGANNSVESRDYSYGVRERRFTWMGALSYQPTPWLELGLDALASRTFLQRGADVITGNLRWDADAPGNPFGQEVYVSLNESLPDLGEHYNRARVDYSNLVLGALLKPGPNWRLTFDAQYARNTTFVRGLYGYDSQKWTELLNEGRYDPLRDTQVSPPPTALYDEVLVFHDGRNRTVRSGDYDVLDLATRLLHSEIPLPSGVGLAQVGADYRRSELAPFSEQPRYGSGADAGERVLWSGRVLQRYSAFGEVQAPLLPQAWLPPGIRGVETDLAVRYVASDSARESNVAPTYALRVELMGGFSVRGSVTQASRYPTPQMSRRVSTVEPDGGNGVEFASIYDPKRDQTYSVRALSALQTDLSPEATVTQTFGLIWQKTSRTHWRLAADFIDTRKDNELAYLGPQTVVNLEDSFPLRVVRDENRPAEAAARPPPIQAVLTGPLNLASRHSQNFTLALNHRRPLPWGGDAEIYARWLYYLNYARQLFPNTAEVDELDDPDGTAPGLLRHRGKLGIAWHRERNSVGLDLRYYHRRILPRAEWPGQGGSQIGSHWELDLYFQQNLTEWMPRALGQRFGLTLQGRVSNVLGRRFPYYANDSANAGVQAFGDWRGRTYSLSVTASF